MFGNERGCSERMSNWEGVVYFGKDKNMDIPVTFSVLYVLFTLIVIFSAWWPKKQ